MTLTHWRIRSLWLAALLLAAPAIARAEEEKADGAEEASAAPDEPKESSAPVEQTSSVGEAQPAEARTPEGSLQQPVLVEEPEPLGLTLDLGFASAYNFRGLNMFQSSSQWNQNAFLAPSVTWAVGDSGLSLGYWGAFQVVGPNIGSVVDAGIGAEQDLIISYSRPLSEGLSAGAGFTAYLYPFADAAVAGTRLPTYLEPALFATLTSKVDLGMRVAYYHGVQSAVSAYRYVYLNPTAGKTFALAERVSLAVSGSLGYKLFTDRSTEVSQANRVDLLFSVGAPIDVVGGFYLKPSVSWAWTDLPDRSARNEMLVYGGVNAGVGF